MFWLLVSRLPWLQSYVNEYAWRYNHRDNGRAMFVELVRRSAVVTPRKLP